VLTEVAPGIDVETQVLALMEFPVKVAPDLKTMDEGLFRDEPMGLELLPARGRGSRRGS